LPSAVVVFLAILTLAGLPAAVAQPRQLDVPYVPTPEHIVEAMLKLAKPTKDDFLVDLGCGDGRIPITAAQKYGVRGFGVDLNPVRINEARANAEKAGVADKVQFIEGDLFQTDFRKASVLTLYLLPLVNMRLRPALLEMKPGTRVVSHAFHMDDWMPDASEQFGFRTVYHWVVPAKVAGRWVGTVAGAKVELDLEQKFQEVSGTATIDGRSATATEGRVKGETVHLQLAKSGGAFLNLAAVLKGAMLEGEGVRLAKL
jgi:ubiquinone/menaquinone biosynthesis C-methylase UbiE